MAPVLKEAFGSPKSLSCDFVLLLSLSLSLSLLLSLSLFLLLPPCHTAFGGLCFRGRLSGRVIFDMGAKRFRRSEDD